jgi:hypothetical protein
MYDPKLRMNKSPQTIKYTFRGCSWWLSVAVPAATIPSDLLMFECAIFVPYQR